MAIFEENLGQPVDPLILNTALVSSLSILILSILTGQAQTVHIQRIVQAATTHLRKMSCKYTMARINFSKMPHI